MKTIRRKLSALLAVIMILGVIAVPSVSAVSGRTVLSGDGTTKAKAITIPVPTDDEEYYNYSLKSTQKLTYFKFKTKSHYAIYEAYMSTEFADDDGVEFIFRRADNSVIEKSPGYGRLYTENNLQPNSWYYLIIKNTKKSEGNVFIRIGSFKDEDRNCKSSAQIMTLGKTYNGTLYGGYRSDAGADIDYYKFTCTATGKYTVIVRAYPSVYQEDAWFIRTDGSVAQKNRLSWGKALIRNCTLTKGRTYYIKVKSHYRNGDYNYEDFYWSSSDCDTYKVRIQKKK